MKRIKYTGFFTKRCNSWITTFMLLHYTVMILVLSNSWQLRVLYYINIFNIKWVFNQYHPEQFHGLSPFLHSLDLNPCDFHSWIPEELRLSNLHTNEIQTCRRDFYTTLEEIINSFHGRSNMVVAANGFYWTCFYIESNSKLRSYLTSKSSMYESSSIVIQ